MAQAKAAFNVDLPEPLARANAAPGVAVAATHVELPQSGYLTADWVKRHYSVCNSTLYRWVSEKRFPAPVKIGSRAVRWSAASLRAFEAKLVEDGQ